MTKPIQVQDEIHNKLFVLRGMFLKTNMSDTIEWIMDRAGYNDRFFERKRKEREMRTKQNDDAENQRSRRQNET